jgi:hypothetical protein
MDESAETNSSTELQTYNSTSHENQMMNNKKDEEVATTEDLLQKEEELLLRQAIRSSSQLLNLAQIYTTTLINAFKEVQLARKTADQIRQIIKEIYMKCFPQREHFLGVLPIVRDVFYEDVLGWKLLPNGKYNPKYWQVYNLTGERIGPTKFTPEYEAAGKIIHNLTHQVQRALNQAYKKFSDKNSKVCKFRPIGPQLFHLLLVAL